MQTDVGMMDNGAAVSLSTIAYPSGVPASVTNLGVTLVSLRVPDRNGSIGEAVLGLPARKTICATPFSTSWQPSAA